MIYCLNCGKGIPDHSKFCTFCGTAIKTADTPQPENTTPVAQEQNVNTTPHQEYVPPPPQQQFVPPPPQQQYVPPPPPPQYVNPTPPQQQYVNPATQQYVRPQPVAAKNEFYKNIGFWGAVLTLVGFFLPYVSAVEASFYYLVTEFGADKPELYMYLIFPVSGAVLIIQALTGALPRALVVIFKILPLLLLILLIVGGSQNESSFTFMGDDVETILSNIGIGLYMTVIGTILMLFFKTTKTNA